jgi:hypothetical protein
MISPNEGSPAVLRRGEAARRNAQPRRRSTLFAENGAIAIV